MALVARRALHGTRAPFAVNSRVAVAFIVIFLSLGLLVYVGTKQNMVYYYLVHEFQALSEGQKQRRVKVSGKVAAGSIERLSATEVLFAIEEGGERLKVSYQGVIPDTFREGGEAVVEGRLQGDLFQADVLMAKCPSKFTGERS